MELTKEFIKEHGTSIVTGRLIEWTAPAAEGNEPYGGKCRVVAFFPEDSHPFHTMNYDGDTLDFAFWDGDTLAYSDGGRYVDIKLD